MYPWSIDAREAIKELSDIDDTFIEETDDIEVFLNQHKYYFVVATKGVGKSLLLVLKRKKLKGTECIIPKDLLLDVPELAFDSLSHDVRSLMYKEESMQMLWMASIIVAIIKNLDMADEMGKTNISESLQNLLKTKTTTVSGNLGEILGSLSRKQFYQELSGDYNALISMAQTVNKTVAVFIDNIDECFEKAGRDIWYATQTSLMRAIYKLVRLNPKLKVFASVRKEAFLKLKKETEMIQQLNGVSLMLSYSKEELREIFIKNIYKDSPKKYLNESLIKTDPIKAFVGAAFVPHGFVNEQEEIFDYIYRHTLRRARDLMEMGSAISRCNKAERNPESPGGMDQFKSIINDAATLIADGYINEVLPHIGFKGRTDFERLFELIDANVLTIDNLISVCMQFNNTHHCNTADCKQCIDKTHVFCELYKIGLLGYVEESLIEKGRYVQKFAVIGEKTFDDVGLLPDSRFYLIHPVLKKRIKEKNPRYKQSESETAKHDNIIGYDKPWKMPNRFPPPGPDRFFRASPPVLIDKTSHRLIDSNGRSIPLNYSQHCVLIALFEKVGKHTIGLLSDAFIARIILETVGKGEGHDIANVKGISEQFARQLRRHLKDYGIKDKDVIIKRVRNKGFLPGSAWDEKTPLIYGSEVPLVRGKDS